MKPDDRGERTTVERPRIKGKFFFVGEEKLYVRGVTYGTFRPDEHGDEFRPDQVEADFAAMAASSINAVRTYIVPPVWMLDAAMRHGLRILVGFPWEQHVTFLDDRRRVSSIERRLRESVRSCAGHPAVLAYVIGNEIPGPIVRWYGRGRIERFLARLHGAVTGEDPEGLVTYLNYPTTEYLDLPFLDFVSFNVYLESRAQLEAYLLRLQNLADERPLLMGEIGLDSRRNGLDKQRETLAWQVRTAFGAGCAGAFVFSWTDEWHRGGFDIEDWDFGLTTREREPKPALPEVARAFREAPVVREETPHISVLVCVYNGESTLHECLEGVRRLEYPAFEVIVVDDGSRDRTAAIVEEFTADPRFRLIRTANRGLSSARNTALEAATGEIVAYLDSDAWPDPHWLTYLARSFADEGYVGFGGPNVAPPEDGFRAQCIASAPGGPIHVMLSDEVAEHIPGCNMAFRREGLREIGGFDTRFRIAGDDVDICWRLQQRGWRLGFSPAALVWHHARQTVRGYWKQQLNYGKAEAALEQKWPEKYNDWGHPTWQGRIYGNGRTRALRLTRSRVYQGVWGSSLFQSIYEPAENEFLSLLLMPEWYLITVVLFLLGALGLVWPPALLLVPMALLALVAPILQAFRSARRAVVFRGHLTRPQKTRFGAITTALHLLQPLARLLGRIRQGLGPLRRRGIAGLRIPWPRRLSIWSETPRDTGGWMGLLETALRAHHTVVLRGGPFARWDLEARGGLFGAVRLLGTVEEHGGGRQMARFRIWPRFAPFGVALVALQAALAVLAATDRAWLAAVLLGSSSVIGALRCVRESARATGAVIREISDLDQRRDTGQRTPGLGSTAARQPATRPVQQGPLI